jgi:hypothetical protein
MRRNAMRWERKIVAIGMALGLAGCATLTPPPPKRPHMWHRVPVNRTVPQEAESTESVAPKKRSERRVSASGVQWQ